MVRTAAALDASYAVSLLWQLFMNGPHCIDVATHEGSWTAGRQR